MAAKRKKQRQVDPTVDHYTVTVKVENLTRGGHVSFGFPFTSKTIEGMSRSLMTFALSTEGRATLVGLGVPAEALDQLITQIGPLPSAKKKKQRRGFRVVKGGKSL